MALGGPAQILHNDGKWIPLVGDGWLELDLAGSRLTGTTFATVGAVGGQFMDELGGEDSVLGFGAMLRLGSFHDGPRVQPRDGAILEGKQEKP